MKEDTEDAIREMNARYIIRDLLEHAVYDRENSDECALAVKAAEAFLADGEHKSVDALMQDLNS